MLKSGVPCHGVVHLSLAVRQISYDQVIDTAVRIEAFTYKPKNMAARYDPPHTIGKEDRPIAYACQHGCIIINC